MRSRVTEAKSLVTQVVTLQPLYKLRHAGICIDDVNIMYHRQNPKAELFSATTMATLTTCCLSIYILDVARTSSPYISSRTSREG